MRSGPGARSDTDGLIISDRGSPYLSTRYSERLAECGIKASAGTTGYYYDTALGEPSSACTKRRSFGGNSYRFVAQLSGTIGGLDSNFSADYTTVWAQRRAFAPQLAFARRRHGRRANETLKSA
jgi:hypothetical protein